MRILTLMLLILLAITCARGENYNLYKPEKYNFEENNNKILFILDFSNSMKEPLENSSKISLMLGTMYRILPQIDKNTAVGLRVYGHRLGFTTRDACRASALLVPVAAGNSVNIQNALLETKPHGMTPITFSLKQAIKNDFYGINGQKRIILLTDGGENCDESPCSFVMELVKTRKDINIDVIAFNIDNDEDINQLECTALVTNGKFYTAKTKAQLINSLNESIRTKKEVNGKIILNN